MNIYTVTMDRVSVRTKVFQVAAASEEEAAERAYALAENMDFRDAGESFADYEIQDIEPATGS